MEVKKTKLKKKIERVFRTPSYIFTTIPKLFKDITVLPLVKPDCEQCDKPQ